MHKSIATKKTITLVTVFLFLAAIFSASAMDTGLEATANSAYGGTPPMASIGNQAGFADFLGKTVGTALSFIGIIFMLLMIYGGFTWMVARGNEQEVGKAKEIITGAVIGLAIVMLAYAITRFIGTSIAP
jgi:uncharacterized BrkB/YihY/UPF0761 family membrane protein